MKSLITCEQLRERYVYDPESGVFTWRTNIVKARIGTRADVPSSSGYLTLYIGGHPYFAHRMAWLYMTGSLPTGDIDHRNGVVTDNSFMNLRDVPSVVNSQNQRRAHRDSATGFLGVSRHGKNGFQARIRVHGKTKFLGTHQTAEAAHAAYVDAKRKLHEGCTI